MAALSLGGARRTDLLVQRRRHEIGRRSKLVVRYDGSWTIGMDPGPGFRTQGVLVRPVS